MGWGCGEGGVGGGVVAIKGAKFKKWVQNGQSVLFSLRLGLRLVSGVEPPTGNVHVPSPPPFAATE